MPTPTLPTGPVCPFDNPASSHAHSTYAVYDGKRLTYPFHRDTAVPPLQEFVHDSFRALIQNPRFACAAAKGAFHRGSYRMGMYSQMASPDATLGLAHDLVLFLRDQDALVEEGEQFSTFIASFEGPNIGDEETFERLLWDQLQALHIADTSGQAWDATVSANPEDHNFAFSFGGRAFYIIGLHPAASRWNRRFAWPTLVFNAHRQFDVLRADGRYTPLQSAIRSRETALQGSSNPMLANFGERSEARQYSGRAVGDEWRCPFHVQTSPESTEKENA